MIKVLHIVSSLSFDGGVQNMLVRYYREIDRKKIKFDFVVHGADIGGFEPLLKEMGSCIYHVTPKKASLIANLREIYTIIKNGKYDVVHGHQNLMNGLSLMLAALSGVRIRISHSHAWMPEKGCLQRLRSSLLRQLGLWFANYRFACGEQAGQWLFGSKWRSSAERDYIMYNAFDLELYKYSPVTRAQVRRELGIDDRYVLIQVGRDSPEKNHRFSLALLRRLVSIEPKVVFLVVGVTEQTPLREMVAEAGLADHVLLLGVRTDIPALLNAADVMLLPSTTEGLGMVAVEAQANGLPVIASTAVPNDARVSPLIEFVPLEASLEGWTAAVLRWKSYDRQQVDEEAASALFTNYSIKVQARRYEEWLTALVHP